MARGNPSRSGWLDEFWTVILAAPFVLAFVPGAQEVVSRGFIILQHNVPEWYQFGVGMAMSWGFAVDRLPRIFDYFMGRAKNGR